MGREIETTRKRQPEPNYQQDLVVLSRVIYRRRYLIILGTVAFSCLSLIAALILPKAYSSRGFFQISEVIESWNKKRLALSSEILDASRISLIKELKHIGLLDAAGLSLYQDMERPNVFVVYIPEFNKYEPILTDPDNLIRFVRNSQQLTPQERALLEKSLSKAGSLAGFIDKVYAFGDEDQKRLINRANYPANFILGVNIKMDGQTPEQAQKHLKILGDFIKHTLIYHKLFDYSQLKRGYSKSVVNLYSRLLQINMQSKEQLLKKKQRLLQEMRKLPKNSAPKGQEITLYRNRLAEISARLVEIELISSEMNNDLQKNLISLHFLNVVTRKLREGSGNIMKTLAMLDNIEEHFLKEKNLDDPVNKEAAQLLQGDLLNFKSILDESMIFNSGPTLPEKAARPPITAILVLGFLFGLLISLLLAFLTDFLKKHAGEIIPSKK